MRSELACLRDRLRLRFISGSVPEWSWQQHVNLLESIEAVLHELEIASPPKQEPRLRVVLSVAETSTSKEQRRGLASSASR